MSKKRTTITAACRWLNEQGCEIPEFQVLFHEYMAGVQQQNLFGCRFGYWMHDKRSRVFKKWYKSWWLRHPEAWDMIYDGCDAATNPDVLPDFMGEK